MSRRRKNSNRITSGGSRASQGQTIIMTKPRIFSLDLGDYVTAINRANNLDYNDRARLYDLYTSILMDGHLQSVIGKRKASALSTPIVFVRDGKEVEEINEHIESEWFDELIDNILDHTYWGFTLLQLYQEQAGWINSDLIDRKHVDPVRKLILRQQYDTTGASWDEFDDLLFVGSPRRLGLLASAAPYALYKRNSLSDWAQFSEIFGMPLREYTYDGNDPEARNRIMQDIYEQGSLAIVIHPEGSNLRFQDSPNKSGSVDVYDRLILRCNNEMSKLILGNTLSTEAGDNGTQALATVQQEGEDYIRKQDRKRLLNILNYQLTDYFIRFGIDTRGGKFVYQDEDHLSTTEFVDIALKLNTLGIPLNWDQIYERTGFRKPDSDQPQPNQTEEQARKTEPTSESTEPNQPTPEDQALELQAKTLDKFVAYVKAFFVHAPDGKNFGG